MQNEDNCHCCGGVAVATPVQVTNRPGLEGISYRAGVYSQFRQSLLARLSGSGQPALYGLTTRDGEDLTIALLDSWAMVADVLTFYQERIANESYLGTATERLSLLELARQTGYELLPGVAAGTYLVFTVDSSQSSTLIDTGVKVQSIPGPGETAQLFETVEPITGRPEWNAIRPLLARPQRLKEQAGLVILKGIANNLNAGDILLIRASPHAAWKIARILSVAMDTDAKTTRVDYSHSATIPPYPLPASFASYGAVSDFPSKVDLDEDVVHTLLKKTWMEKDLSALLQIQGWPVEDLLSNIGEVMAARLSEPGEAIYVMRKRAYPFGYNVPRETYYHERVPLTREWGLAEKAGILFFDNTYDQVLPGGFIVVQEPGEPIGKAAVYTVEQAEALSRTAYGITSKTTAAILSPATKWWVDPHGKGNFSIIRNITFYIQNERLAPAALPVEDDVEKDMVLLDRYYPGLRAGQVVVLTGDRRDLPGVTASEVMELKEVRFFKGLTLLTFSQSLAFIYWRSTVSINANVAAATHGETVREVLGSGDASAVFQSFVLKQLPLTYVSAATATGVATTLEVRVNNILWEEAPYFFGRGPLEKIYITRRDDDGKTTVIFGDGRTGLRLPTGQQNIKAVYRKGIGLGGFVKAGQVSQLATRPLGVKAASNPIASDGAADPETLEDVRRNAGLRIRTLDRIVSLQDYEDFCRAFGGIDKALATWTWQGQRRSVYVTVAGTDGAVVDPGSKLYTNLLSAMRTYGDPQVPLTVASYQPRFFRVVANIQVDPAYLPDLVLAMAADVLRQQFSFGARAFGQAVAFSEVVAVMQRVAGVTAVDIDQFYRTDANPVPSGPEQQLGADAPAAGGYNLVFPAELLMLDPGTLHLNILK